MALPDFLKYFPELTTLQLSQYEALQALYEDWNAKINVISRKDIDNLYEHHVQHSLAIAKFVDEKRLWSETTRIVDVGCGGGFPGIPLAIRYPECHFLLVDRIGKKVRVAQEVAMAVGLTNVEFLHAGIEEVKESFDYSVSRAVMTLPDLIKLVRRCTSKALITLKGGDLTDELKPRQCQGTVVVPISTYFDEEFFATKNVTYTPIRK
ncbi:MAG: 16S rRNA (guanine(527)-N(7))-methyltransferase RsmG [Bacteroidales bacterium]|nr:16S rRNA (guanine(527)-N(7))-methyltransferase RsmG [Bacteroidales bacterium]